VNRARLWGLVGVATALPVAAGSCGDSGASSATLPPIVTASTTTTIYITTTTVQKYYIVKRGDTLGKIAKAFQVRLADIMAINGITNADDIQAGQELQIPTGAVVYNTLPTPPDSAPATT
jgi:LysM repeat protein